MKNIQKGIVVHSEKNLVKVVILKHGDCKSCGICEGEQANIIELETEKSFEVGESVIVTSTDSSVITSALIVFALPLTSTVIGIFAGYGISRFFQQFTTPLEVAFAFIFLLCSIPLIKYLDKSSFVSKRIKPQIEKELN